MAEEKYSELLTKLIEDSRNSPTKVSKSDIESLSDDERIIYTKALQDIMRETVSKFRDKIK